MRRDRGELSGPEVALETKHGPAVFAVGDRVQFTDTDKKAGIYNGNAGTITAIDERSGRLSAVLDAAAGGKGREVSWSAAEFPGFRHGYAGTIYKGQGKTLDHTYLYHTPSLAPGGELCGADPAARERPGVCRARDRPRCPRTGPADGARRGQSRLDRLGDARGSSRSSGGARAAGTRRDAVDGIGGQPQGQGARRAATAGSGRAAGGGILG